MTSLWGEEFDIPSSTEKVKKALNKIKSAKPVEQNRTSKPEKMSLSDRLAFITSNVNRILGRYRENTTVIISREELSKYIDTAISNNILSIDTETNNSLDPLTCQLMGLCLYTPGLKNAYIPVNHRDPTTNIRLQNQLTENDIKEELDRLPNIEIITQNGKFDYEVLKCTCDTSIKITWDTMIASNLFDENEEAGLKYQYRTKIDPSIEKYSIDYLFEDIEYALVDPNVFALYAATDSYMTYKLYDYQKQKFNLPEYNKVYKLFTEVEVPIVTVAADMELAGVNIDQEYAERLSKKYHNQLSTIDNELNEQLSIYKDQVEAWRQTEEANFHPPKKTGKGVAKSKSESLEDPINLASPTQLAILLYDVLKISPVDKKSPRGTGEDILKKIDLPFCRTLLKRREVLKLLNTYIDTLPKRVSERDNRLHGSFKQYGAATGRFSSSNPNL